MIANTPRPPYYAVIFTSIRSEIAEGYGITADEMVALASEQPGYLGIESARNEVGITVSYWENEEAILNWKRHAAHQIAQQKGREIWYQAFKTRVCKVERDYGFSAMYSY
jgi:heme-degrading monooxygenase HmoA